MSPSRIGFALRSPLAAALVLVAAGATACGSDAGADKGKPTLKVFAAASLTTALTAYAKQFDTAKVRLSFAGSDELAVQIEQGVKPDIFAAANTKLPDALYAKGLVEKPTVFAGNKLVLAVPTDGAKVRSLADVGRPGVKLALGDKSVPIGAYTRKVLASLPPAAERAILANVRSEEPNVTGITGKLTQGAVDAGFLYASDVRATDGRLRAITLPASVQPTVAYGAAAVKGTEHADPTRAFIAGLIHGAGAKDLAAAGFAPPPPAP